MVKYLSKVVSALSIEPSEPTILGVNSPNCLSNAVLKLIKLGAGVKFTSRIHANQGDAFFNIFLKGSILLTLLLKV